MDRRWRMMLQVAGFVLLIAGLLWIPVVWAEATGEGVVASGEGSVDFVGEMIRILGFLAVLVALSVLAVRVGKRLEPRWNSGTVQLLGTRTLAPGVGVRLIRVGSRAWLLGVTRERVSLLAELGEQDLPPSKESSP
ncbi:MAG: flagellar biosynthetic protein FliO [Magnetococcus sp. DMHC-1]